MVVLGLLLLLLGIVAILGALFSTSGTTTFLGAHLGGDTVFFLGVATTLAVMCGLVLTRAGAGRALRHRREHRRLRFLERERRASRPGDDRGHIGDATAATQGLDAPAPTTDGPSGPAPEREDPPAT